MQLSLREQEVLNSVNQQTIDMITTNRSHLIGLDAKTIADHLFCDRANISRILNRLFRQDYLIKIIGRPSLFIGKQPLLKHYPNTEYSSIYSTRQELVSSLNDTTKNNYAENIFTTIIGYKQNESLFHPINQLRSAITYPNSPLSTLVYSPKGSDFLSLLDLIQNNISNINPFNFNSVITLDLQISSHYQKLQNLLSSQSDNYFLTILNCELLTLETIHILKDIISKNHSSFILFVTTDENQLTEFSLLPYIPMTIKIPPFSKRTLKERFSFILNIFQEETNTINKNIIINKNVMNCFVMSEYKHNLLDVRKEIKLALAQAHFKSTTDSIEIGFDDISDTLLNNIKDVNNQLTDITSIYDTLKVRTFIMKPFEQNQFIEKLNNNLIYIDDQHLVFHDEKSEVIDNSIENIVYHDIKASLVNDITSLKTTMIAEIYETLNEVSKNQFIVLNDKLYYGLLYRLEKVIDNIKNNNYQQRYCKYQKLYPEFSMYSKSILDILQERYNIQIPKQEELYIHHYLKLSKSIIENYELPMIFIFSNPTTLRNFSLFVESFKSDLKASFLDINLYNFTQKKQELLDTIKNHNKSKGILIITDESLPTEIVTFIEQHTIDVLFINNITIHSIAPIIKTLSNPEVLLDDFRSLSYFDDNNEAIFQEEENVLEIVKNEILDKSLIFLNPDKIIRLGKNAFDQIINQMGIEYDDILAVKFNVHIAFVVERVIRNQELSYKRLSSFVRQHNELLKLIERNLVDIENQFGIKIPTSELIYIAQIFLGHMS